MNKLKSKRFWISLVGMVVMLVQLLGVKIDLPVVSEIVNAVCAALVFFGLITDDGGTCARNGALKGENANDNPDETEQNSDEKDEEVHANGELSDEPANETAEEPDSDETAEEPNSGEEIDK